MHFVGSPKPQSDQHEDDHLPYEPPQDVDADAETDRDSVSPEPEGDRTEPTPVRGAKQAGVPAAESFQHAATTTAVPLPLPPGVGGGQHSIAVVTTSPMHTQQTAAQLAALREQQKAAQALREQQQREEAQRRLEEKIRAAQANAFRTTYPQPCASAPAATDTILHDNEAGIATQLRTPQLEEHLLGGNTGGPLGTGGERIEPAYGNTSPDLEAGTPDSNSTGSAEEAPYIPTTSSQEKVDAAAWIQFNYYVVIIFSAVQAWENATHAFTTSAGGSKAPIEDGKWLDGKGGLIAKPIDCNPSTTLMCAFSCLRYIFWIFGGSTSSVVLNLCIAAYYLRQAYAKWNVIDDPTEPCLKNSSIRAWYYIAEQAKTNILMYGLHKALQLSNLLLTTFIYLPLSTIFTIVKLLVVSVEIPTLTFLNFTLVNLLRLINNFLLVPFVNLTKMNQFKFINNNFIQRSYPTINKELQLIAQDYSDLFIPLKKCINSLIKCCSSTTFFELPNEEETTLEELGEFTRKDTIFLTSFYLGSALSVVACAMIIALNVAGDAGTAKVLSFNQPIIEAILYGVFVATSSSITIFTRWVSNISLLCSLLPLIMSEVNEADENDSDELKEARKTDLLYKIAKYTYFALGAAMVFAVFFVFKAETKAGLDLPALNAIFGNSEFMQIWGALGHIGVYLNSWVDNWYKYKAYLDHSRHLSTSQRIWDICLITLPSALSGASMGDVAMSQGRAWYFVLSAWATAGAINARAGMGMMTDFIKSSAEYLDYLSQQEQTETTNSTQHQQNGASAAKLTNSTSVPSMPVPATPDRHAPRSISTLQEAYAFSATNSQNQYIESQENIGATFPPEETETTNPRGATFWQVVRPRGPARAEATDTAAPGENAIDDVRGDMGFAHSHVTTQVRRAAWINNISRHHRSRALSYGTGSDMFSANGRNTSTQDLRISLQRTTRGEPPQAAI